MLSETRLPSLASLGAFEAVARCGSFAAASRELGTSSASVSYHIRQLERQTGLRLFQRFPHRVVLTETGRGVADQAIAAFKGLRDSLARAEIADRTRLSLSALPTFGVSWLAPRIGMFSDRHPTIRVDVDLSAEARDLHDGRYDAAIRNGHGEWAGLHATYLFRGIFLPLCAPALLGAAGCLGRPDEPIDLPLLGRTDWWASWFRAADDRRPYRFGATMVEEHLAAAAAVVGHGITIGSPLQFRREIDAGRLVAAHSRVIDTGRSFWLVCAREQAHRSPLPEFAQWIDQEAAAERSASARYLDAAILVPDVLGPAKMAHDPFGPRSINKGFTIGSK